ncbi:hypothetical protein LINGRAHAP2_LOCUS16541, partial [Linum grandiflorum]
TTIKFSSYQSFKNTTSKLEKKQLNINFLVIARKFHFNMNSSQNTSYQAGQAKGQAQEKASGMMEKASNAAQSTKESLQDTGSQMQAKAQETAEATKDKLGMNK